MAEHERYHLLNRQRQFSRRELLQKSAAALVTSILPASRENPSFAHEHSPLADTVQKIIEFDATVGDGDVSTEQAMNYVPLLADLYVETINPLVTAEQLVAQTYIVPPPEEVQLESVFTYKIDLPRKGIPFISPLTAHLEHTYSDLDLPYKVGEKIVLTAYDPLPIQGITFTNKDKFIFMGKINDPHIDEIPESVSSLTMFDRINARVACQEASPIVRLRQTVLHEFGHSDIELTNEDTEGYILYAENGGRYDLFEEFFADYMAAAISDKYGFPYTTGYAFEPIDFKNFSEVLKQNHISLRDLAKMHRYSALTPLMSTISKYPEITTFDRNDYTAVRKRTLRAIFQNHSYTPNWETLSAYYPEVDKRDYVYETDPTVIFSGEKGCKYVSEHEVLRIPR